MKMTSCRRRYGRTRVSPKAWRRGSTVPLKFTLQSVEPRHNLVGPIALQFDDENGGRVAAQKIAKPGRLWIQARAIEDVFVNNFHGRRAVGQDRRSRLQSVQQVRKLNDQNRFCLGKLDELKLSLENDAQGSFGADQQSGKIETRSPFL